MNKKRSSSVFQRSQHQITAVIMAIFLLLLTVTLAAVYITSYRELYFENLEMLEVYTEEYRKNGNPAQNRQNGESVQNEDFRGGNDIQSLGRARYLLTYFYSVAFDEDGKPFSMDTGNGVLYTENQICTEAARLLGEGQAQGIHGKFVYYISREEEYTLVTFMDNTLISDSFTTLFQNALIIGAASAALMLLCSIALARWIIRPLKESDARQRRFISDAGHELKTPVSVIEANAELLEREVGVNKWLENIRFESGRMAGLVGELLELARTERETPQTEPIDFSRLVMGTALPFESVAFEMGREIECRTEENVIVEGNAGQLERLVSVLTDNALSHSEGAGNIEVALHGEKAGAVLTISNPGFIPEDKREEIFSRFFKTDADRGGAGHYGLGLTIAKSIVREHDGEIHADCSDGRVTFSVYLPCKGKDRRKKTV